MTDTASPEISDARAMELAHIARWRFRASVCTTALLLAAVTWRSWSTGGSGADWLVGPGLVLLLGLMFASVFGLVNRSEAKAVRRMSRAVPDAYLVCPARDTNPGYGIPGPVLLIVRPSGVSLWNGQRAEPRPMWELAWADIAAAAVVEYTEWHRFDTFDTRPAVRITRLDGQSKLLLLADKNRRTHALMAFPRRVAALLNEHAGR